MTGARAAVALYVAVALHAVALLFLLLAPVPQTGAGTGIGLTLAGGGSVLAPPGIPSILPPSMSTSKPLRLPTPKSSRDATIARIPDQADAAPAAPMPEVAHQEHGAADVATGFSDRSSQPGTEGTGAGASHEGCGGTNAYFARLRTHLAAFRREVADAANGRAEVRFTVLPGGRVAELVLERSSGSARLDAEALSLVVRAQPLPSPPRGEPLRVTVPIYVGG
jgi:protein TonB